MRLYLNIGFFSYVLSLIHHFMKMKYIMGDRYESFSFQVVLVVVISNVRGILIICIFFTYLLNNLWS